jgi:hypothetical protein
MSSSSYVRQHFKKKSRSVVEVDNHVLIWAGRKNSQNPPSFSSTSGFVRIASSSTYFLKVIQESVIDLTRRIQLRSRSMHISNVDATTI